MAPVLGTSVSAALTRVDPSLSRQRLLRAVDQALRSEVAVYAVAIVTDDQSREGAKGVADMREITEPTGGYTEPIYSIEQLPAAMRDIALDLSAQFVLAFEPAWKGDGRNHTFRVATTNPTYTVRARSSYRAD